MSWYPEPLVHGNILSPSRCREATRDQSSHYQSRLSPQKCGCGIVRPLVFPQAVAFVHREWDRASVWLSRGFVGSSSALCLRSHRFQVRSFWTASVETACKHPVGFLKLTPEPIPIMCISLGQNCELYREHVSVERKTE